MWDIFYFSGLFSCMPWRTPYWIAISGGIFAGTIVSLIIFRYKISTS
jgi:hypothetical protein